MRREFGQIDRGGDAERHGDDQGDDGGDQSTKDERQGAEPLVHGIPIRAEEEAPAEFAEGEVRTVGQFVADQGYEHKDGERHQQRKPLEGLVAPRSSR